MLATIMRAFCSILMVHPHWTTLSLAQWCCARSSPPHEYDIGVIVAGDGSGYTLDTTATCQHCHRGLSSKDVIRIIQMMDSEACTEDEVW